ncbi:fatty acid desaturase family protein [Aliiglaciecola sp. LCG003]|uniref:fatty acid desaturase family protein n=1 Tax=Aliiglaciecola sp. LCG003 TaxID=3053655 RepID=UPI0025734AB3|nr:fatty acid desaturase family protein [Aliiglaciecola sp. LCG003]WJG10889.1 fatty acid desaturase family protein [Aliiglaciecola sp. LCG003]
MLRLSDFVTSEEMKTLCQSSNAVGWYRVLVNYALISAALLVFILFPNVLTYILAACIIAGRILGIAILNHDAGHGTLFKSAWLNRAVGRWLLGGLILVDFDEFRKGHLRHHQLAGTEKDPDRIFVQNYPATRASMKRKLFRDISGINGIKELVYQIKVSNWQKRLPSLILHTGLLFILIGMDELLAYSIFWCAYVFFYPLMSRLRIMGEHGAVPESLDKDPRMNTRTTYANLLERLLVAPNNVNYHLEHHIHQNIPAQNLNKAHALFKQRGMYDGYNCIAKNYIQVLKACVSDKYGSSGSHIHAASSVSHLS